MPKGVLESLKRDAEDPARVLERCLKRLEWDKAQERCSPHHYAAQGTVEQPAVCTGLHWPLHGTPVSLWLHAYQKMDVPAKCGAPVLLPG